MAAAGRASAAACAGDEATLHRRQLDGEPKGLRLDGFAGYLWRATRRVCSTRHDLPGLGTNAEVDYKSTSLERRAYR